MEFENIVLVTWDFTEKSHFAFRHAMNVAEYIGHDIGVLHIVKKKSEIENTTQKIKEDIQEKIGQVKSEVHYFVKDGSIFSTITELVFESHARMVFMGTHGMRGMQKFLGSWALKVIAGSRAPFVVVQDNPKAEIYKNIVLPITFRKENKECINWANFFSKRFGAKFHILYAKNSDQNFIKGVESNLLFINKFFAQKGIQYELKQASGDKEFSDEVIEYSTKIGCDAIMVMTTKNIGFADYVFGAQEQYIIANIEQIPVICINPKPPIIGGGFSTFGG